MKLNLTSHEIQSLLARLQHKDENWGEYVSRMRCHDHCVPLRDKIVHFIKEKIKHYDVSEYEKSKNSSDCETSSLSDKYFKYMPLNKSLCPREGVPFILDVGSRNKTSNADLTIMNNGNDNVIQWVIDELNKALRQESTAASNNIRLTRKSLNRLFDITFYLNSFLFVKHGFLVLMNCHDAHMKKKQRKHARHRLTSKVKNPYKDKYTIDEALRKRQEYIRHNDCRAIEMTNVITYFSPDAYHSKGGFTHVLLEIQDGKPVNLTSSDYLDSAFDNLGLLKHSSSKINKYGARIAHALKRLVETKKDDDETLRNMCQHIVRYIDDNTVVDTHKKRLSFSVGILSKSKTIPNKNEYGFQDVFRSRNKNGFYVPGRKWKPEVKSSEFITSLFEDLKKIESTFSL